MTVPVWMAVSWVGCVLVGMWLGSWLARRAVLDWLQHRDSWLRTEARRLDREAGQTTARILRFGR